MIATFFFFEDPLFETAELKQIEEKKYEKSLTKPERKEYRKSKTLEREAKGPRFTKSEMI